MKFSSNFYENYSIVKKAYNKFKIPFYFAVSSILKSISQIGAMLLIARYIAPADFGLWTFLSIFIGYSAIFNIGTLSGLNRELPFHLGKGDLEKANKLAGTAQFVLVISSILSLCIGIILFFAYYVTSAKLAFSILILSFIISLTYFENYFLSTYRSNDTFKTLSNVQFFISVINIISLILIYQFNYWGLLYKTLFVQIVFVGILFWNRPLKAKITWNQSAFVDLLKVGFPIYILAYLQSSSASFDKILILKLTNNYQLGLYSFAFYSFIGFSLFSNSISNYIYPKFSYMYGKTNNRFIFWNYNKKITISLLIICSLLGVIVYLLLPSIYKIFFPKYIAAIKASQFLIFAGVLNCSTIGSNILLSLKIWKYIVIYNIEFSVLLIICPLFFSLLLTDKLLAISVGLFFSYLLNFIFVNVLVRIATKEIL
jgi:O-antigen/teichoic acid export membrane protein